MTLDEAKQMRKAVKDNKVVMQLGHNYNSLPTFHKAREIYRAGKLGTVPLVRMYIDRTARVPQWKFYTDYADARDAQGRQPADHRLEALHRQRHQAPLRRRALLQLAQLVGLRHRHRRRPDEPPVGLGQHGARDGHSGNLP